MKTTARQRQARRIGQALGLLLLAGCVAGCVVFGGYGKFTVATIDPGGNLILVLQHEGGEPKRVDMRFFLDGQDLCPPQTAKRPGMSPRIDEVIVRAGEGQHTLRVEALEGTLAAECTFVAGQRPVYAYVTFSNKRDNQAQDPVLTVEFSEHGPGFA